MSTAAISRKKRMKLACLGALALGLSACVAGPPPEIATPPPVLPNAFFYEADAADAATLANLLPNGDPAFVALSQAAVERSPTLGEAFARIDQARSGVRRAGAEQFPDVSAEAAVQATRVNPNQIGLNLPPGIGFDAEQIAYAANLSARWDPDIFGVLRAQERAALWRLDAAEAGAAAVRLALISEIAATIIDWRTLQARIARLESDIRSTEKLADLARGREQFGLGTGLDRMRADGDAAAARTRLAALATESPRLIGRLITLTTLDAREVRGILERPAVDCIISAAPVSLPSELLTNRPDILRAGSLLAAEDAELAATARRRFPRFDLSAIVGLLAFDLGDLFSEDSFVYTLTAGVAAPLLDFGRLPAEIDGAAAEKKAAFELYRQAVFTALGDTEAAYGLVAAADNEAAAAAKELAQLERARTVALAQYRAGIADITVVLIATREADASGLRAAEARGRTRRARIILWQALGGAGRAEEISENEVGEFTTESRTTKNRGSGNSLEKRCEM